MELYEQKIGSDNSNVDLLNICTKMKSNTNNTSNETKYNNNSMIKSYE